MVLGQRRGGPVRPGDQLGERSLLLFVRSKVPLHLVELLKQIVELVQ